MKSALNLSQEQEEFYEVLINNIYEKGMTPMIYAKKELDQKQTDEFTKRN